MITHNANAKSLFWALAAIVVAAILFGGGGSKYGMANLLVQLTALAALAFHREAFLTFWKTAPLALRSLVAITILLPLAYIVPLPENLWSALPGRDLVVQSRELIGANGDASNWASASVEPVRTLLAATALITPLAVLAIGWSAPRDRLITIGWIAVALGLANLLLGVPQVLSNSEVGVLYPENPMPGVLFGTFANRNSTGLFLVGTLALAALLPASAKFGGAASALKIAVCVLLLLAIVLTQSRTALALAALPLGLAAVRFVAARTRRHDTDNRQQGWFALACVALIIGAVAAVGIAAPGRLGDVMERFDSDRDEARAFIWEDATYSAQRFWPVGAGTGTFDDVFQIDESLENLTPRRAGRAHNDYLEVAIETGVPGLALIAAWFVLLAWLAWRARKSRDRWVAWSGGAVLLAVALQSITDYPLRNQSLLAFAALALLLLVRFGRSSRETRS